MNNASYKGVLFMLRGGEEEGTLPNTKTHPYGCAVIVDMEQGGVGGVGTG